MLYMCICVNVTDVCIQYNDSGCLSIIFIYQNADHLLPCCSLNKEDLGQAELCRQ